MSSSAWQPFIPRTTNPVATGRLDAAIEHLREHGWQGRYLAEVARQFEVGDQALRNRIRITEGVELPARKGNRPLPDAASESPNPERKKIRYRDRGEVEPGAQVSESGVSEGAQPVNPAGETTNQENTVFECEKPGLKINELQSCIPDAALKSGNLQSPETGLARLQRPVLTEMEVDRHDEDVATLARDSIQAFQRGKNKGPAGRRVIPITRVSDLVALDTLYRRATRQGEREPGSSAAPVINVRLMASTSRETVRRVGDPTSKIVDAELITEEIEPR